MVGDIWIKGKRRERMNNHLSDILITFLSSPKTMVCWLYKRIDVTRYEEMENMKQKNLFVLDEKDDKAVQLFTELGMPKNLAKTLIFIAQIDECKCADVEKGADLRQPEVSIAMQELLRRGWVKKRDLKGKGKGRPVYIYKPTTHLSEIWKAFEQEKLKEVETIKNDISELKNIIVSR